MLPDIDSQHHSCRCSFKMASATHCSHGRRRVGLGLMPHRRLDRSGTSWIFIVVTLCLSGVTTRGAQLASPRSAPSRPTPPHVHHVAGLFEVANFSSLVRIFDESISTVNGRGTRVALKGVPLMPLPDPQQTLAYICDAVLHNNVTAFLAIGSQRIINVLSIVTTYVGIPVVGFNTQTGKIAVKVSLYFMLCSCVCSFYSAFAITSFQEECCEKSNYLGVRLRNCGCHGRFAGNLFMPHPD